MKPNITLHVDERRGIRSCPPPILMKRPRASERQGRWTSTRMHGSEGIACTLSLVLLSGCLAQTNTPSRAPAAAPAQEVAAEAPSQARDSLLREIETHRRMWRGRGPAAYSFRLERECFCFAPTDFPLTIVVRDGEVESRTNLGVAGDVAFGQQFVVEAIFDTLQSAVLRGERVDVTYGPELGFPVEWTTSSPNFPDSWLRYRIIDFEILNPTHPLEVEPSTAGDVRAGCLCMQSVRSGRSVHGLSFYYGALPSYIRASERSLR